MAKKHFEPEVVESAKLNEVIITETRRPDGSLRVQQDFQYCPSMTEQHSRHFTDLNYLIEKYKPDEIAAYIAARSQYRQEITGHDFSLELSLQDAHNQVYAARQIFLNLDPEIQMHFKSPLDFVKFIDNPANAQKMLKMGLLKQKDLEKVGAIPTIETNENKAKDNAKEV